MQHLPIGTKFTGLLLDMQDEGWLETPLPTPASFRSPRTPYFDFSKLDTIDQETNSIARSRKAQQLSPSAPAQSSGDMIELILWLCFDISPEVFCMLYSQ